MVTKNNSIARNTAGNMLFFICFAVQGSQECGRYKARAPRNTGGPAYGGIEHSRGDNAVDAVLLRTALI